MCLIAFFCGGKIDIVESGGYNGQGQWRTAPTANLTDRGFTGHMHNNLGSGAEDIGLVYMAARWYAPTLGRFISADTLIPNPANPQSYNRYSYVGNRVLNATDPTGHRECDIETLGCSGGPGSFTPPSSPALGVPINDFYKTGDFTYQPGQGGHKGVDLGPTDVDVLASAEGIVRIVDYRDEEEGNFVVIEYGWCEIKSR